MVNYADNYIETVAGDKVYFEQPERSVDAITIPVIARALSNICRFTGHMTRFYSVARHSLNVYEIATVMEPANLRLRRTALLHDATEAFLGDVSRPLKELLPSYKVLEQKLWSVIADRYFLFDHIPYIIKEWDVRILYDERDVFVRAQSNCRDKWGGEEELGPISKDHPWILEAMPEYNPANDYREFMDVARKLELK